MRQSCEQVGVQYFNGGDFIENTLRMLWVFSQEIQQYYQSSSSCITEVNCISDIINTHVDYFCV